MNDPNGLVYYKGEYHPTAVELRVDGKLVQPASQETSVSQIVAGEVVRSATGDVGFNTRRSGRASLRRERLGEAGKSRCTAPWTPPMTDAPPTTDKDTRP
ncbi:hypothetical protein O3Q52_18000 [Streptomyces sp. ActVer]|uniref:hypothetical protein n=1 Tax=Streptomyces sp. ActVer TaxID=3014558 RepID=UPI0022B4FD49|nr:hypothetical protein [Streptomyces sp. ActVer]MCZ4510051.1 hypothetical protein [Streptomyces sp. ActVer]